MRWMGWNDWDLNQTSPETVDVIVEMMVEEQEARQKARGIEPSIDMTPDR